MENNFYIETNMNFSGSGMTLSHFHDSYEMYYMLKGSRRYFIDDGIYVLEKGDVALIRPNLLHKTVSVDDKRYSRILLYFKEDFSDAARELLPCFDAKNIRIPKSRVAYFEGILLRMCSEYEKPDEFSERLLKGYLTELLVLLSRVALDSDNIHIPEDINEAVKSATAYIRSNYAGDISLSDAANAAGMSRTYFSARFRVCTGFGFSEFLNSVRLMNAERLLTETNMSVIDIATACGYNDSSYFSKMFKKMKGMSPLQYRKFR